MSDGPGAQKVVSLQQFTREESVALTDAMLAFAHSPQCAGPMHAAKAEIFGDLERLSGDLVSAVESEACRSNFHTWFLFDRHVTDDGHTVADVFADGGPLQLTRGQRIYLERMRASHLHPYRIRAVRRDVGLELQSLWNGQVTPVRELTATYYAVAGSTIFARVIDGPRGEPELHGMLSFPSADMSELLRALRLVFAARAERHREPTEAAFFKDVTPWILHSWLSTFGPPRAPRRSSGAATKTPAVKRVLQLEIVLERVRPRVWRRLLVPEAMTLKSLSASLERAMGWESYHLHRFEIDGIEYGVPDNEFPGEMRNENGRRIGDFGLRKGSKFFYDYDFGDGWRHRVRVDAVLDAEPGVRYPRCVEGENACPPEDVGGVGGYADFLRVLRNPRHEDHEHFRTWSRRGRRHFDPHRFEVEKVNEVLRARVLVPSSP
jgi:hypothetical protein